MKHRISLFHGARDAVPTPALLDWTDLAARLSVHEFRPVGGKLDADAWSPAAYPPGARRGNANVETISTFVADLDGVSDRDVEALSTAALARGWSFVVHSTWSHATKPTCVRAVFPLSREVTPAEWPDVWDLANHALGGFSDTACRDAARIYFGAFAPDTVADRAAAFGHVFDGSPIDVDALLGSPPASPPSETPHEPAPSPKGSLAVTREQLQRFGAMLARKRDDASQEHGTMLSNIVRGEPFADVGGRDAAIFRLACVLAQRWPEAAPQALAVHFAPSLAGMGADCPGVDVVAYKIERAQRMLVDERTQGERAAIRDAFGTDRSTPYTPDEIAQVPAARWVIQKGRAYYARVLDTYRGPYAQEEAQNALVRDLSPASSAGVECYTVTQQGVREPKSLPMLVRSYGFVADDIAADMSASKAYFDERARTLVEAPCPIRKIEPTCHPEIDTWLDALAGDRAHLLRSWIAAVTLLDKPCTGLLLSGHKHTGKSLLPEGLSRLWTKIGMPTPLEDVLGTSFNASQLRCPLVFADERLPTDHRGHVMHAELRHYIQARRRPLRRKFLPNSDLIGAVRVIVSANSDEILSTTENLSNHDLGAIVDRWLNVPCSSDAYDFLRSHDTSTWVEGDKIAEHALHLRDNYQWTPNGRFLVHGEDGDLVARLVSGTGTRSAVLQFCVGYLLNPAKLDNDPRGAMWIRTDAGRLCVNVQAMLGCWSHYVTNEPCPPTGKLARAIGAIASKDRPRLRVPGHSTMPNFRVIENEHLIAWATDKDFASKEEIEAALAQSTTDRVKALAAN